MAKLEYVHSMMQQVVGRHPKIAPNRRISEASKLRKTLARHYAAKRRLYAEDFPDFHDPDLLAIFGGDGAGREAASVMMRHSRRAVVDSVSRWTGQRKYVVDTLVRKLMDRCRSLNLRTPPDRERLTFDLAAYLAALITNQLHTGRFKRRV